MKKIDNLTYDLLQKQLIDIVEKKYKVQQIFEWIHKKNISHFKEMTNISLETRKELESIYEFTKIKVMKRFDSKLDETKKYILLLEDENIIESVFLKYSYGNTACISSQVGCKMGCKFCASTKNGLIRNLSVGEMLGQIYKIQMDTNEKINNIVIMGSGEPLENYDNVINFIKIISNKMGQNISLRKITLSTCGIINSIYKLAKENLPITLAISLHAAEQNKREKIIPSAKKFKLMELMEACDYYIKETNRRMTFEYIMIENFNDTTHDAYALCKLLKNKLCNINLIPYNFIRENKMKPSQNYSINRFKKILLNNGLNATVRRELGSDINAACGQLRNDFL